MQRIRTTALVLFSSLLAIATAGAGAGSASAGAAVVAGSIQRFDSQTLQRLPAVAGSPGDEFGTRFRGDYVVSAPGAKGGGRFMTYTATRVLTSIDAADLPGPRVARFGESYAYLGHPPLIERRGTAVPVGAPGSDASVGVLPAVVVVRIAGSSLVGEVSRVTGPAGSRFGWRVVETDVHPESYFASYFVSAPLGGALPGAGAVYKFDTHTGAELWRFDGERDGEMAGYGLLFWPDANGDGVDDVLVSAPGTRDRLPAGRLYILSGADGSVLRRVDAPAEAVLFGFAMHHGGFDLAPGGVLVAAPATSRGRRPEAGAVYIYRDFDAAPRVLRGRRPAQWFGISIEVGPSRLYVGSFEGNGNPARDHRGSVTVMLPGGRVLKTLRGRRGGEYFGREIWAGNDVLSVGAPGALPSLMPTARVLDQRRGAARSR